MRSRAVRRHGPRRAAGGAARGRRARGRAVRRGGVLARSERTAGRRRVAADNRIRGCHCPAPATVQPLKPQKDPRQPRPQVSETESTATASAAGRVQERNTSTAIPQRSFLTRSAGLMTSVRRIPNFSLITTTSPWAIRVPLMRTSIGSPAMRSSSTTEPRLSASRS